MKFRRALRVRQLQFVRIGRKQPLARVNVSSYAVQDSTRVSDALYVHALAEKSSGEARIKFPALRLAPGNRALLPAQPLCFTAVVARLLVFLLPANDSIEYVRIHSVKEKSSMNSEQLTGKWNQMKGTVREKWGRLTDDDVTQINGKRDQLIGRIQERYGLAKEAASKQVDEWLAGSQASHPKTHQAGG